MGEKQKFILIVDDDPQVLFVLEKVLGTSFPAFSIRITGKGSECLQIASTEQPELILLDMKLPDMNGLEVCRKLRESPVTREIPILMMTGAVLKPESKIAGLNMGADAYLFKPFDNTELIAQVRVMLRIRQTEVTLRTQKASLLCTQPVGPDG